jgi:tetratricopeptide (TPR) repeat protein
MSRRWGLSLAVALVLFGASAGADTPPTKWDRAKSSVLSDAWDLHERVREELYIANSGPRTNPSERMTILNQARDELERAGAGTSPDVRLRFDLGDVYFQLDHFAAAISVLEPALALAPNHPAAESAWNVFATAHAKLDHSVEEIHGYDKILELTLDVDQRGRVFANRAEAEMRLGRLDEAIRGYRDAIAISESVSGSSTMFEESVLARWGLAVALDRSGDPSGALREAALAVSENGMHIIQGENVFFVPKYELAYYLALGVTSLTTKPLSPKDALQYWSAAEDLWLKYAEGADAAREDCGRARGGSEVAAAKPGGACPEDRWLPIVRLRLAHAQKERANAEKRAGTKRVPRGHLGRQIMVE